MKTGDAAAGTRGWRSVALALLAIALPAGCGEPDAGPAGRPGSPGSAGSAGPSAETREMAARLFALADSADPLLDEQLNTARLRYLTRCSSAPPTPRGNF